MATPELPEGIVAQVAVFIGTAIGAIFLYLKSKKDVKPIQDTDRIIAGGSITDMEPVRELASAVDRVAQAGEKIFQLLHKQYEEKKELEMERLRAEVERLRESASRPYKG